MSEVDYTAYALPLLTQLRAGMETREQIEKTCEYNAQFLKPPFIRDKKNFLIALSGVESSFGANAVPRWELGYSRSSMSFKRSEDLQLLHKEYGDLGACSFGPFQILAVRARELGFWSHPLELWMSQVSCPYVVKHLNDALSHGAKTEEHLMASYNAGYGAIKNPGIWPRSYVEKFQKIYWKLAGSQLK